MTAFLLTPDNIDHVKRALRPALSDVGSAHLTEAIAAAFGFRTHAALTASLKAADPRRPGLAQVDVGRFSSRLEELGYERRTPDLLTGSLRSPDVPDRHWVEFKKGDRIQNERWFLECRQRDIPNIRIESRRKYVNLEWDCISIDPRGEDHLRHHHGSALVNLMFKLFQVLAKPDPGKSEFYGSAFVGSVNGLLPAAARSLADAYFTLLYTPMTQ